MSESERLTRARENLLHELVAIVGPTNAKSTLKLMERFIDVKVEDAINNRRVSGDRLILP